MKLILLFLALIIICNADNLENTIKAVNNMKIPNIRNVFHEAENVLKEVRARSTRVPSPQCFASLQKFANVSNSQCGSIIKTLENSTFTPSSVTQFCVECENVLITVITNINVTCTSAELGVEFLVNLTGLFLTNRFLCVRDPSNANNYCSSVLYNVQAYINTTIGTDYTKVTQENLVKICVPCVHRSSRIVQQLLTPALRSRFGVYFKSVLGLRPLCVRVGNEYCALKLKQAQDIGGQLINKILNPTTTQPITKTDMNNALNVFCGPCFKLLMARLALAERPDPVLVELGAFGSLCRRRKGEFCAVTLFDEVLPIIKSQGRENPCANSLNSTCSTQCKDFINKIISKGGCCWSVLVDYSFNDLDSNPFNPSVSVEIRQQLNSFFRACIGKLPPAPCPSYANATIIADYLNLDLELINENQGNFLEAFLSDIYSHFQCRPRFNATIVSQGTNSNGQTTLQASVQCTTDGFAAGVYGSLDMNANAVLTYATDPASEVEVTTRSTDLTVESYASKYYLNFFLLAFILFFQIFN